MPSSGRMVTHFSRGSLSSSHGFSTSPFLMRREWKYRWERSSWRCAAREPKDEAGREGSGEAKGLLGRVAEEGAREMGGSMGESVPVGVECWRLVRPDGPGSESIVGRGEVGPHDGRPGWRVGVGFSQYVRGATTSKREVSDVLRGV